MQLLPKKSHRRVFSIDLALPPGFLLLVFAFLPHPIPAHSPPLIVLTMPNKLHKHWFPVALISVSQFTALAGFCLPILPLLHRRCLEDISLGGPPWRRHFLPLWKITFYTWWAPMSRHNYFTYFVWNFPLRYKGKLRSCFSHHSQKQMLPHKTAKRHYSRPHCFGFFFRCCCCYCCCLLLWLGSSRFRGLHFPQEEKHYVVTLPAKQVRVNCHKE